MTSTPSIIFWNARSLITHITSGDIEALFTSDITNRTPPLMLAVVETQWRTQNSRKYPQSLPSIHNYQWSHYHPIQRRDNKSPGGGIALLHHNSIAVTHLDQLSQRIPTTNPNQPMDIPPVKHSDSGAVMWLTVRPPHAPTFLLGIAYIPPQNNDRSWAIQHLTRSIDTSVSQHPRIPMLLIGDLNLRHSDWGDTTRYDYHRHDHDPAPSYLATYLTSNNLLTLNTVHLYGLTTCRDSRFPLDRSKGSIIDLAITNTPSLVSNITMEHEAALNSDHLPLTIYLSSSSPVARRVGETDQHHTTWKHMDNETIWQAGLAGELASEYQSLTTTLLSIHNLSVPPGITPQELIQTTYSQFEQVLLSIFKRVIGTKKVSPTTKNWFGYPGVKDIYNQCCKARTRYQRSPTPQNKDKYLNLRHQQKQLVTEAKFHSWRSLCHRIQTTPHSRLEWSAFKRTKSSSDTYAALNSFRDQHGQMPPDHLTSLNNLTSAFVSFSIPPPYTGTDPHYESTLSIERRKKVLPHLPFLDPHASDNWTFTTADVAKQFTQQNIDTASGPDHIIAVAMKYSGTATFQILSAFYSYSWYYSVLPQQWTEANVMALYKGDGEKSNPNNFRPLSITSIIIRSFEHLIHRKISAELESRNYFHPLQFGFRHQHSTADAINYLLSSIRHSIKTINRERQPCPVIFLDLQKAFDRVWHDLLLHRLSKAGINGLAYRWISAFLSNRKIRVIDHSLVSSWQTLSYGVPQGCVLSPILFLIFINDCAIDIAKQCPLVNPLLFADDQALAPNTLIKTYNHHEYFLQLKTALSILTEWCSISRMRFGEAKTKLVIFWSKQHRYINHIPFTNLHLCGFNIGITNTYKYLGVIFHHRLQWTTHYNYALQRARQDAHRITRILAPPPNILNNSYSNPSHSLTALPLPNTPYFAAIRALCLGYLRPRFSHGIMFWCRDLSQQQRRSLQSAFIQPMRYVLSLPITTHQLGVLVETHCPSIQAMIDQSLLRFAFRTQTLPQTHPTKIMFNKDSVLRANHTQWDKPMHCVTTTLYTIKILITDIFNRLVPFILSHQPNHPLLTQPNIHTHSTIHDLTLSIINTLPMWQTYHEWRTDTGQHDSAATLKTCKFIPHKSLFLDHDTPQMCSLRVRLRADRAYTQVHQNRFISSAIRNLGPLPLPKCTYLQCSPPYTLSTAIDSTRHILLHCPRHTQARAHMITSLLQHHIPRPGTSPILTVPLITGTLSQYTSKHTKIKLPLLLNITGTFLHSIIQERSKDSNLTPLDTG
jgi:hypothetical protein